MADGEMTVRVGIRTELSTDARVPVRLRRSVLRRHPDSLLCGIFSAPERSEHVEPHLLGR